MKTGVLIATVMICWPALAAQQPTDIPVQDKNRQSNPPPAATAKTQSKKTNADLPVFELDPSKRKARRNVDMGSLSRGGEESTVVLYAPNLGLTYTLRPVFSWKPLSGAQRVKFQLFDSNLNELYETEVTGHNSFTYPQDAPELEVGATYSWTIHPRGSQAADPVRIMVLSGADRHQLQQALQNSPGGTIQGRIQQAQILVDHRLWYDAVAAYSDLITSYRKQPDLYERRAEIYASLPETQDLAKQDRAQAERLRGGDPPPRTD